MKTTKQRAKEYADRLCPTNEKRVIRCTYTDINTMLIKSYMQGFKDGHIDGYIQGSDDHHSIIKRHGCENCNTKPF